MAYFDPLVFELWHIPATDDLRTPVVMYVFHSPDGPKISYEALADFIGVTK